MTIFRVQHNQNYTTINNTIAKDNRLSWKAKGIWMYAFSRPDVWEFNIIDLCNQSTDGRDSVRAGLRELEEHGYLLRNYKRTEEMKFSKAEWIFYEVPQIKEKIPQTENPSTENPSTENPTLVSTDIPNTEKTNCFVPVGGKPPITKPVIKQNSKKQPISYEIDEIFRKAIAERRDWTTSEIEEAWKIFEDSPSPVNDGYAMIAGIIDNLRKKNKSLKQNKTNKQQAIKNDGPAFYQGPVKIGIDIS